jgi:hypothetical protein
LCLVTANGNFGILPWCGTSQLDRRRLVGKGADLDYHAAGSGIVEAVGLGAAALEDRRGWGVETGVQKALMQLVYSRGGFLEETDVKEFWIGFRTYNFVVGENENETIFALKHGEFARSALVRKAEAEDLLEEAGEFRYVEYWDVDVIQ